MDKRYVYDPSLGTRQHPEQKVKGMLLVIDYDDTFTADKTFWRAVLSKAIQNGHTVVCCTFRAPDNIYGIDITSDFEGWVPIVYSRGHKKSDVLRQAGYIPENAIWIDDSPQNIW